MKKIYIFPILILGLCLSLNIFAKSKSIYHALPVDIMLNADDQLIVDYDFSQHKAIRCQSRNSSSPSDELEIEFIYKGYPKSALLPAVLLSDHLPNQADEHLADINGQFSIHLRSNPLASKNPPIGVSCAYVGDETK